MRLASAAICKYHSMWQVESEATSRSSGLLTEEIRVGRAEKIGLAVDLHHMGTVVVAIARRAAAPIARPNGANRVVVVAAAHVRRIIRASRPRSRRLPADAPPRRGARPGGGGGSGWRC